MSVETHGFQGFHHVDNLYKEGLRLKLGLQEHFDYAEDKFAWLHDDEFARQTYSMALPPSPRSAHSSKLQCRPSYGPKSAPDSKQPNSTRGKHVTEPHNIDRSTNPTTQIPRRASGCAAGYGPPRVAAVAEAHVHLRGREGGGHRGGIGGAAQIPPGAGMADSARAEASESAWRGHGHGEDAFHRRRGSGGEDGGGAAGGGMV